MDVLKNKKITVAFLVILATSGFLAKAASAELVSPGERIRFIAKNRSDSAGPMEGVTTAILSCPSFVVQEQASFPNTISKGGAGELVFGVNESAEPGSKGTISIRLTTNMQTEGLACIPESWKKSVFIEIPDDVDNPDPTFIQLSRGTSPNGKKETPYQFSPQSSPGVKDTLDIDYNLAKVSLVTILIYDADGNLIKTLVDGDLRDAGDNIDIWDGKDDAEEFVFEGGYRFIINAVDAINPLYIWNVSGDIVVDNTLPTADIDFIKADTPRYDRYTVMGTASDEHIDTYIVECIDEDTQLLVEIGQFSVEKDILGLFNGLELEEGAYTIRLTVQDFAGNSTINELPLVIDRITNGLKIHIDSIIQNVKVGSEGYIPTSDDPDVWMDDKLPVGSTEMEDWEWDTDIKYSGRQSHTDPVGSGTHGHYFIHADRTLQLNSGDNIIQYVYLDPSNPPQEIMLQFYTDDGDGEHRVYWNYSPQGRGSWGSSINTGGQNGTASLYHMGTITEAGKWIRLKIPVADVGLSGKEVKGVAFVTYYGKTYWDKTTKSSDYNETQEESWLPASQIFVEAGTDTVIDYSTSQDANIVLSIYDANNNLIRTSIDEFKPAGFHQIVWDGKNDSGTQVPDGRYYFQFSSPDWPIDSNSFALMDGDFSSVFVDVQTSVTDSEGNTYEIDFDNNIVNKYDVLGDLLFSISNEQLGVENFNPVALGLDVNDNLFIVDENNSRIFKLESHGYYLTELPYTGQNDWEDESIILNTPVAVLIDDVGDMFVANNEGAEIIKLGSGRGVIDVSNITAHIRIPYEDSLVYTYIPIIGTASARNFDKYIVEYGAGDNPSVWTPLVTSFTEVFDDHEPLPGTFTLYGNLATWHVTPNPYDLYQDYNAGLPMGTYTIRLTVYNQEGDFKQDSVRVEVARAVCWWEGGEIVSSDGLVTFNLPRDAIADNFDLFLIKSVDAAKAPPIDDPELIPVSKIYQFRPPGYQFLKTCTLKMRYTDVQLGGIDENTLKIYRWNPVIGRWIFVYANLDTANNVLTTTLSEFNDYEVYYAIIADPPPAPVIYQPASPTNLMNIIVYGKASPSVNVEVFVDGVSCGTTQADENTGNFVKPGVQLHIGDNYLTALAVDPVGNTSPLSEPVLVQVVLTQPTGIVSLAFKTNDFSSDFTNDVAIEDSLYIELQGTDADPASIDTTSVTLTSNITDSSGILIQLSETAPNSGIYRGIAKVGETSDASTGVIGVSSTLVETITVTSNVDPTKQDSLNTRDMIPPPAPIITSSTHPSLCQDTFEVNLGEWANMSNSYGATVTRSAEASSSGNYSVKLANTEEGGDFANYIRTSDFDAKKYPLVSFDYKIPEDVKLNLVGYVNGMWKEIVFTDAPKTVETFDEDVYLTIGYIEDVKADSDWHHTEFNLYNMLKNDDPNQAEYIVEELFFADYNLPGWMELIMGEENPQGAAYYIDNFIITEGGKSNNNPAFTWSPNDASVVEYSYCLDQNPDTVPDEVSQGSANSVTYSSIPDGVWYFHLRSLDSGGNWGPANHYQMMIDTVGPIADSPQPQDGSLSGSLEAKVRITDGSGSGVDPDTIQLKLNDTIYDMNSGGLKYDKETGILTFSLWKVFPLQDPWLDGETIEASLIAADDFAGNPIQEVLLWSWTVDYSQLAGGYLSLLTTQGGFTPTWSPDGSRIAFMSERSGNKNIWVIDADDYAELKSTARQLTFDENNDHHPSWSPVDERIAFISNRNGYEHIWIINADSTGLTQLTTGDYNVSHPTWSSDGAEIAFSRDGEIWTVNADGTNETQITINSIEYNLEPIWSPDGNRIAFTKSLYVDEVAVMDADGSNHQVLTESGWDSLPTWSKHTDQIIFVTKRDEKISEIWVMESNGSIEGSYIDNESMWWDSEPEQSPVNENIAFQSTRNGTWNIWVKTYLQVTGVTASPDPFSPNNDGIKDTVDIRFNLAEGTAYVDLKIYDAADNLITTLLDQVLGVVGENVVTWDGTDKFGNTVVDGTYTYKITVAGAGGAETIEKSGTVDVDTTPPSFNNWIIPDIYEGIVDPQNIAVTVEDITEVNTSATQLQYGIAATAGELSPSLVNWTDFGTEAAGTLDLSWSNYPNNYLYIRCYAEDNVGNAIYSDVQKDLIGSVNNIPSCTVLSPNGEERWSGIQDIKWSAIDLDGDALSITLEYSLDSGVNWIPIESDFANEGIYSWDTKTAGGDSDSYLIRIRAFDGRVWGEDQSDNHFTVDNTAPPAVTTLTSTDAKIGGTIDLDWSGYVETEDLFYYKIYQSELDFSDVIGMSEIGVATKGSFTHRVNGLINGQTYYFAVTALDDVGNEEPYVITASAIPTIGMGSLSVASVPPEAMIYLGGNYAYPGTYYGLSGDSSSPLVIPDIAQGKKTIYLTYPGYEPYYQLLDIIPEQTTPVEAELIASKDIEFTLSGKLQDSAGDLSVGSYSAPFVVDWDNDGKKDLIVGNGGGEIYIYLNSNTDSEPVFTQGVLLEQNSWEWGFSPAPFIVDWDNDEKKDLITGDDGGYVMFYRNTGTDAIPLFDTVTPVESIQVSGSAMPFVVDWNNDRKKDFLIGDETGNVNLYINIGNDNEPLFDSVPDIPLIVEKGNAAPFVVTDWDKDGDKDLIMGDSDGYVNLYLNSGSDEAPVFNAGTYIQAQGIDIDVGNNSTPFVVDWNNDGMRDLLIGNSEGMIALYLANEYVPPTVLESPTGLVAYAKSGKVGLQWNAVEGAVSYNIYRADMGDTPIGSSTTTVYIDYTVVNGTTYTYTVTALDSAGNESLESEPVNATPTEDRRRR